MNEKPDWLSAMFPWPQSSLNVNGRRMAFIDEGPREARPVLLLHGNRDFVRPLTDAGYRVVAPDCIGAGYSDKPRIDGAYSLAHHIADLVSLIDQLGLTGLAVVGQDWGGPQGVGAALRRLDRLAAITLMNTWLFTDYQGRFHTSPPLDHLARPDHRPVFPQTAEDPLPRRTLEHHAAGHVAGRGSGLSPRL